MTEEARQERMRDVHATCLEIIANSTLNIDARDLDKKRSALMRLLKQMESGSPLTEAELDFL